MNRGAKMRYGVIVALFGLFLGLGSLVALYVFTAGRIDYSTINHIKDMQRGPNSFHDLSGDIAVSSADDVGYKVDGEYSLTIYYGKQIIHISPNAFKSEEFRSKIGEIGIKLYHHVNEDGSILYKVTYWDEDIDEYVYVN